MKILIGACGIGKGHCIRQYEIGKELIKRGHEIRILTYNEGVNFFKDTGIKNYNVYVPIILFRGRKLNWLDCIKRNIIKFLPGTIKNIKIYFALKKDNFIPDVCISDYEPVVARIAYKFKKTLINVDQHSKFIYMKETDINGHSCIEERKRLNLFFPKADRKFVVSFYNLPKDILPENVEILYPIIRNDLKLIVNYNEKLKNIVVYFSKYIDISIQQSLEEIIEIFNKFSEYKFIIFSTEHYQKNKYKSNNIIIEKNNRTRFIEELSKASGVISTAGHTLISEAMYCNIPTFVIPLPSFDQNYCGKFIKENNIGYSSNQITYDNLKEFLENIEIYKNNLRTCESLVKPLDSLSYIVDKIEEYK